jgi:hypothetical protein
VITFCDQLVPGRPWTGRMIERESLARPVWLPTRGPVSRARGWTDSPDVMTVRAIWGRGKRASGRGPRLVRPGRCKKTIAQGGPGTARPKDPGPRWLTLPGPWVHALFSAGHERAFA